jgi:hypothetical protein
MSFADVEVKRGTFIRDPSGLWHFQYRGLGHIDHAIRVAIGSWEWPRPAWFWFNGTPAPMFDGDTPVALRDRWAEWRSAYQSSGQAFLQTIQLLAKREV